MRKNRILKQQVYSHLFIRIDCGELEQLVFCLSIQLTYALQIGASVALPSLHSTVPMPNAQQKGIR